MILTLALKSELFINDERRYDKFEDNNHSVNFMNLVPLVEAARDSSGSFPVVGV